jgi:hypothetical protein
MCQRSENKKMDTSVKAFIFRSVGSNLDQIFPLTLNLLAPTTVGARINL